MQGEKGKEAFKIAVDEFLTIEVEKFSAVHLVLPIPMLYLLSKADEHAVSDDEGGTYDLDPSLAVSRKAKNRLQSYAANFRLFGVDFITSAQNATPLDFDKRANSAGFGRLLQGWIVPAVKHCRRRPGWSTSMKGLLMSPNVALGLRRRIDPAFGSHWNEEGEA